MTDFDITAISAISSDFLFPAGGILLCVYIYDNVPFRLSCHVCGYAAVFDCILQHQREENLLQDGVADGICFCGAAAGDIFGSTIYSNHSSTCPFLFSGGIFRG